MKSTRDRKEGDSAVVQDKPRWKKKGGGSFRLANGKIIKPNQVFRADISEIPEAFRDVVIPFEEDAVVAPPVIPKKIYKLEQWEGEEDGWRIVNMQTGKALNTNPLTRKEAEQIIKEL